MPRNKEEHVSLWHPWIDKPVYKNPDLAEKRHKLALWSDFTFDSVDRCVQEIGGGSYYALCRDILLGSEVDPLLLRDPRTEAYLSRTGGISALRVKSKRKSGFLIPGTTWGQTGQPTRELLGRMNHVFNAFGFEALTPSSLSEKVLRSTMADKLYISRPSDMLRRSLIANSKGGRIDSKKTSRFYPVVYENDMNKAYLHCSRVVPSPFVTPIRFSHSDIWQSQMCSWMEVEMTCHRGTGIQPIQIKDEKNGELREPRDGEHFTDWLWSGELRDCVEAGYTLYNVNQGWGWPDMSDFMSRWSDILWDAYSNEQDEAVREIEKNMMVGLPGRFLKSPEKYTLVHKSEALKTDLPLVAHWQQGESPLSEWCMRVEQDIDSAQLTYIGSFIVAECRRKLYADSLAEERQGNKIVRVYIDSFSTTENTRIVRKGNRRGEYKTKIYQQVRIVHNRFMGYDEHGKLILKAPSVNKDYNSPERQKAIREMELITCHDPP